MSKIRHQITLREKPGRHMFEREPRYDVLLNGEPVSELYYNMRGYRGAIPTVRGGWMDIGERGISAWRKEVAWQNKHAKSLLSKSAKSTRRIRNALPTEDKRMVFAISVDTARGATRTEHYLIYRREFLHGRDVFGQELAPEFFEPMELSAGAPDAPAVLLEPQDAFVQSMFPDVRMRVMNEEEARLHRCEIVGSYATDDPDVLLAVACENDSVYSGRFVTRSSFDFAEAVLGGHVSLADLTEHEPVAITNEADLPEIRRLLPAMELGGQGKPKLAPEIGTDIDEGISPWA